MFREQFHSWRLTTSCRTKIHISPGVEKQSPSTGQETRTRATWPDSGRWELRKGAQTCTRDIISWAFNGPHKQILLVTETRSGNGDYPPTFTILQLTQIWKCTRIRGPPSYALAMLQSPSPPPPVPIACPLVSFGIFVECVVCFVEYVYVRDGASDSQQEKDVERLLR